MAEILTLNSGAILEIPAGVKVKHITQGQAIKLVLPEKGLDFFVIEEKGKDVSSAIAAAWKEASPSIDHKISKTHTLPAPDGFDESVFYEYASDDADLIQAMAQRKGDRIWVFLTSGSKADASKRSAQISNCMESLNAPGMIREDLSQKPLQSIRGRTDQLDQFITYAMKELDVPGFSIAVIEEGEIIFEKGYGVKKWGEQDKVDAHTLMKIGSTSKSLTTLLMGQLISEGKFDWHTKVQDLYPPFCVDDEALSKTLEMEHLVSASTGLPRKDFPMVLNYKARDVFQQLATTKPTTNPKETFQYNNQLLTAAGHIAAHTVYPEKSMDEAFSDLMFTKVFHPMGMARTTFTPQENFAFPHSATLEGEVTSLTLQDDAFTEFAKPAGGVWSSAHDMALYVITELSGGINARGERVFDEQNLKYRRTPQVKAGHNVSYGLGWLIEKKKGLTHVNHGGATLGFGAAFGFYPEKQCGFVMLTNGWGGHTLNDILRRKLLELWFDASEKSSEAVTLGAQEVKNHLAGIKEKLSEPSADWIRPFLGKHYNEELGFFEITQAQGGYFLDVNDGLYKARLMAHEGHNGESSLSCADPWGIHIIPIEGNSFKIMEAQHTYVFKKVGG